jgi:hypothetical protein
LHSQPLIMVTWFLKPIVFVAHDLGQTLLA